MATEEIVRGGSIFDRLRQEIIACFDSIQREFDKKREALFARVAQIEQEYYLLNKEIDVAIVQLEKLNESTVGLLTSNLLEPTNITTSIDEKIAKLKQSRKPPPHELKLEYNMSLMRKAINSIAIPFDKKQGYSTRQQPLVKVGKKGTERGLISDPSAVCFCEVSSTIYVVDQSGRIIILDNEGGFLDEFKHSKLQKPWGVYVHKNFVYATEYSDHLLFKFSLSGECLVVRGGKGDGVGKFISPLGVFAEDKLVYVCDELNKRIQIFDLNLDYQGKFSINVKPQDINIYNNLIYILALFQSDIFVYSKNGELVTSIVFNDTIEKMYFFTIDRSGNFIFSGEEKNLIFICSPQGELINTLGKNICSAPQGVAVDSIGRIICVCDVKKDVVQIY